MLLKILYAIKKNKTKTLMEFLIFFSKRKYMFLKMQ